jgi:hypothetical protein
LPELDGQVHHDTHVIPMGNYVIEVGKSLIRNPSQVGNYKIVHRSKAMAKAGRNQRMHGRPREIGSAVLRSRESP